jgi:hypothetical protein
MSCPHANPPGWHLASGGTALMLAGTVIIEPDLCILFFFCYSLLSYIPLEYNEIIIPLEFDTVGRSRLLYHGNGVALIIHFSRPTHLA